jgi:hypothetical protein
MFDQNQHTSFKECCIFIAAQPKKIFPEKHLIAHYRQPASAYSISAVFPNA